MTKYNRIGMKASKVLDGFYWVQTTVNKKMIICEYNGGRFYRYDQFHPYQDNVDSFVLYFKRIITPKMIIV